MKKSTVIVIASTVIVAGAGIWFAASRKPKVTYDTVTAAKGSVVQTVQATGTVTSSTDIDLKFEVSGRIRSIAAAVGDQAKAGTVLATLDDRDAGLNVQKAAASLAQYKAQLDTLLAGSTSEDVRIAEVAVENAQTALANAQQALADAQQSLADTKTSDDVALEKAYVDLKGDLEALYNKSNTSMQTLQNKVFDASGNRRTDFYVTDSAEADRASAAFKAAQAALTRLSTTIVQVRDAATDADVDRLTVSFLADAKLIRDAASLANTMMQGAYPNDASDQAAFDTRKSDVRIAWSDMVSSYNTAASQQSTVASTAAAGAASLNAAETKVNVAGQNVKIAQGALDSAQATLALKQAPPTSAQIEGARAQISQASAALNEAELALEKTKILAPFDGLVARVLGRVGQTVGPGDVIMSFHGDRHEEVEADIPETDVAKLAPGMKATITLDAYGGDAKFGGELLSIDTTETVIQDIVYYKTRFSLDEIAGMPVRDGMTANVSVIAARRDGVIVVTLRAVHTAPDGSKLVNLLKDGKDVPMPVTIGLRGDENAVEVLSGLSEGDKVILATRVNGKIQ